MMPTYDDEKPISDDAPVKLIPNKSDHEIAQELKDEMVKAAEATLAVLDKAMSMKFSMNVQFGPNAFGKMTITQLVVSKVF